jgi:hypothetical protein
MNGGEGMVVLVLEGWRGEEKGERHGQKEYGTLGLNRRLGHGLLFGRGWNWYKQQWGCGGVDVYGKMATRPEINTAEEGERRERDLGGVSHRAERDGEIYRY